ncbi:helix-turn-helix domain-containing protein [Ancylobacter terrae]|uniref:helix-turn-helix domain-containing protein n=1 Tax=Ancylobacter sp. sgz301288 TaxID=3342077 RepID=UPI00385B4FC2
MAANHCANHSLRRWRLERGLTCDQAGALIGVHGTAFGKYELGRRFPRPSILAAIIRATDGAVTANDFLAAEHADPSPLEAAE